MWTLYEKKSLLKSIRKIPTNILQRYELWKRIMELEGLQGLRAIKGFYDEALKGKWKGYRSSRLSLQWRVLYRLEENELEVCIIEVNAHDYR